MVLSVITVADLLDYNRTAVNVDVGYPTDNDPMKARQKALQDRAIINAYGELQVARCCYACLHRSLSSVQ